MNCVTCPSKVWCLASNTFFTEVETRFLSIDKYFALLFLYRYKEVLVIENFRYSACCDSKIIDQLVSSKSN